jgi:hypothetical protein
MARVIIKGFKKFEKAQIIRIAQISERQLEMMARQTETVFKRNISSSLVRPSSTGNLENNFYAEKVGVGHWGVGNITVLNSNAPYWRHVNYGSQAIGADFQHRVPAGAFSPGIASPSTSAFRAGRWNVGTGGFSFIPTKPIEPHNFIQRTTTEVPKIINTVLRLSKGL